MTKLKAQMKTEKDYIRLHDNLIKLEIFITETLNPEVDYRSRGVIYCWLRDDWFGQMEDLEARGITIVNQSSNPVFWDSLYALAENDAVRMAECHGFNIYDYIDFETGKLITEI